MLSIEEISGLIGIANACNSGDFGSSDTGSDSNDTANPFITNGINASASTIIDKDNHHQMDQYVHNTNSTSEYKKNMWRLECGTCQIFRRRKHIWSSY